MALWPVVPKKFGDLFESLAGAVFVDSGESNVVLWKVFYPFLKSFLPFPRLNYFLLKKFLASFYLLFSYF
jgi:hypothetical protein